MKNLYKYKNHLTREEMEYIDKNINENLLKDKKIICIAEFPNMSTYAVHVLKMCDNFPNDFPWG